MTQETESLQDVIDEYLHWRKVNPHIKGGENYLQRLARARLGKGEVDRAFDDGARFAIAMKNAKPVEVEVLADALAESDSDFGDYDEQARFLLNKYNVTEKL